jgi:hypothetical protein
MLKISINSDHLLCVFVFRMTKKNCVVFSQRRRGSRYVLVIISNNGRAVSDWSVMLRCMESMIEWSKLGGRRRMETIDARGRRDGDGDK